MNKQHDMLTYRWPRTVNEAFGTDATSACAITRYPGQHRAPIKVAIIGLAVCFVMAAIGMALK